MLDQLIGFLEVFVADMSLSVMKFKNFPDFGGLEKIELFNFRHFGLCDDGTAGVFEVDGVATGDSVPRRFAA